MRKTIGWVVLALFISATAFAAEVAGPDAARQMHREEMKKVKASMREAKKNAPAVAPTAQGKSFWEKEGERSGLASSGSGVGSFFRNLNPAPFFKKQQEQYNARKAGKK